MDKKRKPIPDSELEGHLSRLYRSVSPEPDFARRLENQLDERARQMASRQPASRRSAWWSALGSAARWGWGLAGMALLVAVIVFAVSLLPNRPSALPLVASTQATSQPSPGVSQEPTRTSSSDEISPPATSQTAISTVAAPVPAPVPGVITYTVVEGDTLLAISEKFGVSVASIFELNQLETGDVLAPGMQLLIAEVYRVVPGDTCASIAFSFGVSVEQLVQANNLSPSCDNLRGNQELIIPVGAPEPEPEYVLAKQDTVNLRQGPGTSYEVVGTLSTGEKLLKNGDVTSDGWVPVEYPQGSGETAYVWVELVIIMNLADAQQGVPAPADWVRLSNPRTLDDRLLVDVCFNLLDDGDWMIRDAVLRIDQPDANLLIVFDSSTLISLRPFTTDSEGNNTGERCDALEFPLGAGTALDNPMLSILSLEAYPREGQDCDLYLERVQPLLTARDTGVLITCEPVSHASGDVTVVSRPDDMSLEAAQALVYQAYQDTITLRGPWEFDLSQMLAPGSAMPDLEAMNPLLAELRALNLLRARTFLTVPGWVHLQYRSVNRESGGILPDGKEIPAEYRMDEWYELDENGRIVSTVARMLDLSGEPLQVSVLQEGEFTNYTFEDTNPQEVFYLPPLDFGFTDLAENALKTNKTFTKQPLYANGSYVGDQYIIQDSDVRWESVYDPATGRQLSFTTWQVIREGLQLVSSVVVETLENAASPPADVLALLEATPLPKLFG